MLNEVTQFCADCREELPPDAGVFQAPPAPWVEPKPEPAVPVILQCPNCSNKANPGETFCAVCGTALDSKPDMRYAGFLIRFVAFLVDWMVLFIANIFLFLFVSDPATYLIASIVIAIAYYVGFWTAGGATPGKMALGLRITREDGGDIGLGHALMRLFGVIINGFTLYIGYLFIIFTPRKRGLHDLIAGTVVIHTN
jgi:uncharacterized RDD family membrane protein YckC